MPQNQGPIVVQGAPRANIFGQIIGGAGAELLGSAARAAGGFLSDLIHPDEAKQAQVDYYRYNQSKDAMEAYQRYLQETGKTNDEETRKAFAQLMHLDDDQTEAFGSLAAANTVETQLRQQANPWLVGQNPTESVFSSGGLSANVPPPPKQSLPQTDAEALMQKDKQEATLAGGVGVSSAPRVAMPVGASATAQGASYAQEQAAKQEEAKADTIAVTPPQVDVNVEPVAPPAAPPSPVLTPQQQEARRLEGLQALTRIQGNLMQLGQLRLAGAGQPVNPAHIAQAAAYVMATQDDINAMVNAGRILSEIDPHPGIPGTNYGSLAYDAWAFDQMANPVAVEALRKSGQLEDFEARAKAWKNALTSGNLKAADMKAIIDFKNALPTHMGNQTTGNFILGKMAAQRDQERLANETTKLRFDMAQGERESARLDQQLANQTGLAKENIATIRQARQLELLHDPLKVEALKQQIAQNTQRMQQEAQEFGIRIDSARLSNLVTLEALQNKDLDRALNLAGVMYTSEQGRIQQKIGLLKERQSALTKLDANNKDAMNWTRGVLRDYAKDRELFKKDYASKNKDGEVDALARQLAEDPTNVTETDKVKALAALMNPDYGSYIIQSTDIQKDISDLNKFIAAYAEKDQGLGPLIAQARDLIGKDPSKGKTQFDTLLNQYLTSNVIGTGHQIAVSGVKGRPTSEAMAFLQSNPTYLYHLLGKVQAEDGKISHKSNLGDEETLTTFYLSRATKGNPFSFEQFAAIPIPATANHPAATVAQRFGKNTREAYNDYLTFYRVGR